MFGFENVIERGTRKFGKIVLIRSPYNFEKTQAALE